MIVIIPARRGSKRIPGKNKKFFNGKPIILQVIELLKNFKEIKRIIVSTDDPDIAVIAKSSGAEVPFMRPDEISGDFTDTITVIKHAIKVTNLLREEVILCVYPTSIFIDETLIMQIKSGIEWNPSKFVFSVKKYSHPITRAFKLSNKNQVILEKKINYRTQDLPVYYHDAGQIYAAKGGVWLSSKEIISTGAIAVELNSKNSIDIDYIEDWEFAEILFNLKNSN